MATRFGKFARKVIGKRLLSPRWIKFGALHKINGTIKLQRICRAYSMPFEPIKVYECGEKPLAKDISGADRIIVRAQINRWEYITKNASLERLKEIASDIECRIGPPSKWKFIIQKVGLRENIESYGTITLYHQNDLHSQYYETAHKLQKAWEGDVFNAHFGSQPEHSFEFNGNRFSQDSRKFIDEKIGSQNAHEMIEYLQNKVKRGDHIALRFVRYNGEKKCFFYDMTFY